MPLNLQVWLSWTLFEIRERGGTTPSPLHTAVETSSTSRTTQSTMQEEDENSAEILGA